MLGCAIYAIFYSARPKEIKLNLDPQATFLNNKEKEPRRLFFNVES